MGGREREVGGGGRGAQETETFLALQTFARQSGKEDNRPKSI